MHERSTSRSVGRTTLRLTATAVLILLGMIGMEATAGAQPPSRRADGPSAQVRVGPRELAVASAISQRVAASMGEDGRVDPVLARQNGFSAADVEAMTSPAVAAAARCLGRRYYSSGWTWAGYVEEVGLNSCDMSTVSAGGGFLAAVAALISALGFAPAAIVAAVLGLGSATLRWCSRNGTGSRIYYNTTAKVAWCNQQ